MSLSLYTYRAVANGLRTDHPIPDMPFVNDSHIPVDDPDAVEAVGRQRGEGMWGRVDPCREGGFVAFTTDQFRHDLAWCVRWHPDHGRSVVLYRDEDASSVHMALWGPPLLFRSGGYWWDGTTWYRPSQVWDRAREDYLRRPVPAATTITAADLLAASDGDPARGRVLEIIDVDPDAAAGGRWLDDLALWALRRSDGRALSECVVKLTAPELTGDQLIGTAEMAQIAGVAASTFRAYVSRGENSIPLPQATIGGRAMWSRRVAGEWAEARRRSTQGAADAMSTNRDGTSQSVGVADLWNRFAQIFFRDLWENPDRRQRWALRWRNDTAVRDVAADLGWSVAASLDRIIPLSDLGVTIRHAVLDELAEGQRLERSFRNGPSESAFYGISRPVTRLLDWLIRHDPGIAAAIIGEIVGDAEDRLHVSRAVSARSLETALSLDGKLEYSEYTEFLDRALPPGEGS